MVVRARWLMVRTIVGQGLSCQGYGQVSVQLCKLASPSILTPGPFINRAFACLISGAPAFWGRYVVTLYPVRDHHIYASTARHKELWCRGVR